MPSQPCNQQLLAASGSCWAVLAVPCKIRGAEGWEVWASSSAGSSAKGDLLAGHNQGHKCTHLLLQGLNMTFVTKALPALGRCVCQAVRCHTGLAKQLLLMPPALLRRSSRLDHRLYLPLVSGATAPVQQVLTQTAQLQLGLGMIVTLKTVQSGPKVSSGARFV